MQNGIHSSLQGMANHDYQGACYYMVFSDPVYGPGERDLVTEVAQMGFCSWNNDQSCTTPSCKYGIGEEFRASSGKADCQNGY